MSRPKSLTRAELIGRAMVQFWRRGYAALSMDDLVRAIGTSRSAVYSEIGSKDELLAACLEIYDDLIVTPAFARVEAKGAGLPEIVAYFEHHIGRAEASGLPGPGCFMANTMTELAPHHEGARSRVARHNERLRSGFRRAVEHEASQRGATVATEGLDDIALGLVVFANGLWSFSRATSDAKALRPCVAAYLGGIAHELDRHA
jgi:TetR/AcrR family transcriptional repressor of nem operon